MRSFHSLYSPGMVRRTVSDLKLSCSAAATTEDPRTSTVAPVSPSSRGLLRAEAALDRRGTGDLPKVRARVGRPPVSAHTPPRSRTAGVVATAEVSRQRPAHWKTAWLIATAPLEPAWCGESSA